MTLPSSGNKHYIESILLIIMFLAIIFALYDVGKAFFGNFTFALIFGVSLFKPYEHLSKMLGSRRKSAAVI